MKEAGEQMFFEDLPSEEEKKEYPRAPEYEPDCNVCGGSGPCFACARGRELAKEEIAKAKEKKGKPLDRSKATQ